MKVQREKAKNQGVNLIQSGECKMCFCMHKNLSSCPKGHQTIPPVLELIPHFEPIAKGTKETTETRK